MNDFLLEYGGMAGIAMTLLLVVVLLALAVTVFSIIVMVKIFKKAGYAGWEAIVPFYNMYVLFKITWGNGWFFLLTALAIIPVVGLMAVFIITIITYHKLSKSFGKNGGFTVGLIFLNFIFMAILAFDKSTYLGTSNKKDKEITNGNNVSQNNQSMPVTGMNTINNIMFKEEEKIEEAEVSPTQQIANLQENIVPEQLNDNIQPQTNLNNESVVNATNVVSNPSVNNLSTPQENQKFQTPVFEQNQQPLLQREPQIIETQRIQNAVGDNPIIQNQNTTEQVEFSQINITQMGNSIVYCEKCGTRIDKNSEFCHNCGNKIVK